MPKLIPDYDILWNKVRDERPGEVVILVHPLEEFTVRRMIRKRKNDDLAFKVQCDHEGRHWRLVFNQQELSEEQVRLRIYLVKVMPLKAL